MWIGLPQTNVARLANVSQAKVSRLLAKAREKGLVRITVAEYDPRDRELEQQLTERLGLRQAVVVKTAKGLNALELRQSLTHFAAPWVAQWIPARGHAGHCRRADHAVAHPQHDRPARH